MIQYTFYSRNNNTNNDDVDGNDDDALAGDRAGPGPHHFSLFTNE